MEGKSLRSVTLFAKQMVGSPMGFEFSAFRMALNRDQDPMDNARVYKENDKNKEKLIKKLPPTDIKAKVQTKAPRRN